MILNNLFNFINKKTQDTILSLILRYDKTFMTATLTSSIAFS